MPRFIVEFKIPNAGRMSVSELRDMSIKCSRAVRDVGAQTQWMQSYVTDDKIYSVYIAPSTDPIREHAVREGFPLDSVREVKAVIDPTTAE